MVIKQALPHNNEVVAMKSLCCIRDNTLVIDRQIAERFGIGIEFL